MKTSRVIVASIAFCFGLPALALAAKVVSDLIPPPKRQATVELAERLAKPTPPPPLPADLPSPFNPPNFEKPDTPDPKTAPAAVASGPQSPAQPVGPVTNREILEALAAQITPSGMMQPIRGGPQLLIGGKRFEVGTRFTASYNNEDYELELVTIDRTTFTLRYRNEEITRPIKPVR